MSADGEFYFLRHSLGQLRKQVLASTVRGELAAQLGSRRTQTKLVISSSEINDRHGTGVLLGRIFDPGEILSLISRRDHRVDGCHVHLQSPDPLFHRERARQVLAAAFRELAIDGVLVVPHFADEVRTALLLREISGVPIVTWMMDDPSLGEARIPREELAKLFAVSAVRFAISPAMASAFRKEFGGDFHVLPPTVSRREASAFSAPKNEEADVRRSTAFLLGNVWNRQWLDGLARVLPETGWTVDWFGPSADRRKKSLPSCIVPKGFLDEKNLKRTLSEYPFAILATGADDDAMRTLTLWSFPSRLVFLFAACRIPVLVVGSPESCAASIVRQLGVGTHCAYDAEEFRKAAVRLADPEFNQSCRERCHAVADFFLSDGLADWIWKSGKSGHPPDERFGFLR